MARSNSLDKKTDRSRRELINEQMTKESALTIKGLGGVARPILCEESSVEDMKRASTLKDSGENRPRIKQGARMPRPKRF